MSTLCKTIRHDHVILYSEPVLIYSNRMLTYAPVRNLRHSLHHLSFLSVSTRGVDIWSIEVKAIDFFYQCDEIILTPVWFFLKRLSYISVDSYETKLPHLKNNYWRSYKNQKTYNLALMRRPFVVTIKAWVVVLICHSPFNVFHPSYIQIKYLLASNSTLFIC